MALDTITGVLEPYTVPVEIIDRVEIIERELPSTAFNSRDTVEKAIQAVNAKTDDIERLMARNAVCFETVSDMVANEDLQPGMFAHTDGFHASGDGGAAYYKVSNTGNANGMNVLALQGSLFATLVITEPYVTPEMFGAYGDGTHDDTNAFLKSLTYSRIVMDNEYFVTSSQRVSITSDIEITGIGKIKQNANTLGVLNLRPDVDGINIRINGIEIDCNNYATCGVYIYKANSSDFNITVKFDSVEIYNMQNNTNELGTAGINISTGSRNIIIKNCNFHDSYKAIDVANTIACRFISLAYLNGNAIINNCTFGAMHNLTTVNTDFDCIGVIQPIDKRTLGNALVVSNCTFNHTFCRCIKTQGMLLKLENNNFDLKNCIASKLIDVQYTNIEAKYNKFVFDSVTNNSLEVFRIANYGSSLIENNTVISTNTTINNFIYALNRNTDTALNVVVKGNIVHDVLTFFRTDIETTTNESVILIESNIFTASNNVCYLDNWETIENVTIEIIDNICKSMTRTAVRQQATKLRSIYLNNNTNLREWVLFDEFDFGTLKTCKFVSINTSATNAPTTISISTFYRTKIEAHLDTAYIEVICITKDEGLQYGTISRS